MRLNSKTKKKKKVIIYKVNEFNTNNKKNEKKDKNVRKKSKNVRKKTEKNKGKE